MIWTYDERRNLASLEDKKEALEFAVTLWIAMANEAIEDRGLFYCALSGGSTPRAIYEALAERRGLVDFSKVRLYFSDERCVSQSSHESNFHMAWTAGLNEVIADEHIFPMYASGDPHEAALAYEKLVAPITFDLVMLGLGEDGHTASLFPHTHALRAEERQVVANFLPEKEVWRLTLTFNKINQAREIHFYVFGKSKAEIVKEVLGGPYHPDHLPAQKIGTPEHKALFILDNEAASLIV